MVRRFRLMTLLLGVLTAASAPRAAGQEVLVTPEQALREIFPEGVRFTAESRAITSAARVQLERELGRRLEEDSVSVTVVRDALGAVVGYAAVGEEIGKYRPITFMVGVTPGFAVRDVSVLAYRESRGGDVKRRRFLAQYRGKTTRDPIDLNRDIINISGATISVRAVNAGVRRLLAEVAAAYGAAR